MVKYLERPEPGEQSTPHNHPGEGYHAPSPAGELPSAAPRDWRRWQHEFAPVQLNTTRRLRAEDPSRRTSTDRYAVPPSQKSEGVEPRSDTSAAHAPQEMPSDNVPDDVPQTSA